MRSDCISGWPEDPHPPEYYGGGVANWPLEDQVKDLECKVAYQGDLEFLAREYGRLVKIVGDLEKESFETTKQIGNILTILEMMTDRMFKLEDSKSDLG